MYPVLDTNHNTTSQIVHLQADKITTVIRYVSAINPSDEKTVKNTEAKALAAAGIKLALVNEGWGDFAHGGISAGAGERDAEFCVNYVPSVGISATACIFFAVDTDATQPQISKLVLPYFAAVRTVFQAHAVTYRVGVYGSGLVCRLVVAAGGADLAWLACSMGWTESRSYLTTKPKELVLLQHLPQVIANLDTDPDEPLGDFGDFVPFGEAFNSLNRR